MCIFKIFECTLTYIISISVLFTVHATTYGIKIIQLDDLPDSS